MHDYFRSWLISSDDTGKVVNRLNGLLGDRLCQILMQQRLPEVTDVNVHANGLITAIVRESPVERYRYRMAETIEVQALIQEASGQKVLQRHCQCFDDTCMHATSAVIAAVAKARSDVGALLATPGDALKLILSTKAHALLEALDQSTEPTEADLAVAANDSVLVYLLERPVRGLHNRADPGRADRNGERQPRGPGSAAQLV